MTPSISFYGNTKLFERREGNPFFVSFQFTQWIKWLNELVVVVYLRTESWFVVFTLLSSLLQFQSFPEPVQTTKEGGSNFTPQALNIRIPMVDSLVTSVIPHPSSLYSLDSQRRWEIMKNEESDHLIFNGVSSSLQLLYLLSLSLILSHVQSLGINHISMCFLLLFPHRFHPWVRWNFFSFLSCQSSLIVCLISQFTMIILLFPSLQMANQCQRLFLFSSLITINLIITHFILIPFIFPLLLSLFLSIDQQVIHGEKEMDTHTFIVLR